MDNGFRIALAVIILVIIGAGFFVEHMNDDDNWRIKW